MSNLRTPHQAPSATAFLASLESIDAAKARDTGPVIQSARLTPWPKGKNKPREGDNGR